MQLFKAIKNIFIYLKSKKLYFVPGLIVFFILFLMSSILNFNFDYMGNKSEKFVDLLTGYYIFLIVFQLIKILVVYLLIGAILNIIFFTTVVNLQKRYRFFNKKENLFSVIISIAGILLFVFFVFAKKLILNPQPYVENFAAHSKILKSFLFFLTDRINPIIFDLFIIIISAFLLLILILSFRDYIIRIFEKLRNIIIIKQLKIILSVLFLIILVIILYNTNIIFYSSSKNKPNILILSADALRPDHMSCNGYDKKTTPNIDDLVKNSIQFRKVFTTVPRTFPAWVSILTSKYPLSHGISHMFPRTRERNKKFETAVDYFNQLDYRTTVISDFAGDIFPRIDLGFKKISTPDMNLPVLIRQIILEKQTFLLPFITNKLGLFIFPEIKGIAKLPVPEVLTEETIREIKSARGKPFFIVTFYSITHFPFSSSYPYYKKYTDEKYIGPHKYFKDRVLKLDNSGSNQSEKETAEDNKQVNALYDGCLNQFDFEVGKIIDYLKKKDLLDNTIVIITSDHGENLYEKNFGMGHGEHLRGNYSLEVPFIIYSPNKAVGIRKTYEQTSSIIDIMPTIFEIAKFTIPEYFEGTSIIQKTQNKVKDKDFNIDAYCETGMWFDNDKSSPYFFHHERIDYPDISGVSEIDFSFKGEVVISQRFNNIVNGAKHRTIYSGRYKLIYVPLRKGVKFELYDYISDPDNNYDLSATRSDILEIMKKKFYSFINEKSSGNYIIENESLFPVFFDPVF